MVTPSSTELSINTEMGRKEGTRNKITLVSPLEHSGVPESEGNNLHGGNCMAQHAALDAAEQPHITIDADRGEGRHYRDRGVDYDKGGADAGEETVALRTDVPFLEDGEPNLFWGAVDMEWLRKMEPRFIGLPPPDDLQLVSGRCKGEIPIASAPEQSSSLCCPWSFR